MIDDLIAVQQGSASDLAGTSLVAIAMHQGASLPAAAAELDEALGGVMSRALKERDFRASRDELFQTSSAKGPRRVLMIGMGAPDDAGRALRRAASLAARRAREGGCETLAFIADAREAREVQLIASGLYAGAWEYRDLKTPPPAEDLRPGLRMARIVTGAVSGADEAIRWGRAVGAGQSLTRTLGMMPGNHCTPEFLTDTAHAIARRHGMKVTVLGREEMRAGGFGAFLAVAQGTPQDPRLIVLEHRRGPDGGQPVVFVGKGLCFDSGGISIKPAQGMEMMKFDMSGGGAVLGAMEALGQAEANVNAVGIVGATTNLPSGTSAMPGDVVRAHSGRFIEIINTDAEGRLVLADLLSYARSFNPSAVIDAATLTGAVVVALGHAATGLFSTSDELAREVLEAGKRAGEPSWQLPLWEDYRDLIKSDVADVRNTGGRAAGSITAALFLKDFATGYPWVHLDVAGTAYSESDLTEIPQGPTGVPLATFVEFARARAG